MSLKPCFIWKHQGVYHVVDIHCNLYGQGASVEQAVESASRNYGIMECEIDME